MKNLKRFAKNENGECQPICTTALCVKNRFAIRTKIDVTSFLTKKKHAGIRKKNHFRDYAIYSPHDHLRSVTNACGVFDSFSPTRTHRHYFYLTPLEC